MAAELKEMEEKTGVGESHWTAKSAAARAAKASEIGALDRLLAASEWGEEETGAASKLGAGAGTKEQAQERRDKMAAELKEMEEKKGVGVYPSAAEAAEDRVAMAAGRGALERLLSASDGGEEGSGAAAHLGAGAGAEDRAQEMRGEVAVERRWAAGQRREDV